MKDSVPLCPSGIMSLLILLFLLVLPVSAVDDVWRALGLASNEEMADMITTHQMYEHDQRRRQQVSSNSAVQLGDKCGGFLRDDTCGGSSDLECTQLGPLWNQRCLPMTCFQQGMQAFYAEFGDMSDYKTTILEQAGLTLDDLRDELSALGNDRRAFLQTSVFQSLQRAISNNPAPANAIFDMYDNCAGTTANGTTPLNTGERVNYLGLHLEIGVLADTAFDAFWQENDDSNGFVRYCIGGGLGGGVEFSFLYLMALNTNDAQAIGQNCHFVFDVDFGVALQMGMEYGNVMGGGPVILGFTIGLGIGASGAVGVCGISKN
ncbi:expressed unknown protein [Seminavis robusta]|uniref:Uncharacterized protein n=1 Tax=Seminavis robusta TaxID=568900 RepID=A0A9N8DH16_9STRA|nr:expressed unknown protein [Seminavis robusta]|eukprot:Sro122_g059300.1 n/a (320) ;mRNA; r:84336-85295